MGQVIVTRHIAANEPGNESGRAWEPGDIVYECTRVTYGCCDGPALTLNRDGDYPFFELPKDAITGAMMDISFRAPENLPRIVRRPSQCDKPGDCPNGPEPHQFKGAHHPDCCAKQDWE